MVLIERETLTDLMNSRFFQKCNEKKKSLWKKFIISDVLRYKNLITAKR